MPAGLARAWRQAAAALIEAAIPADTELPATWPACAALLPHAQAVLDLTSGGMWRIAQYLGHSGSYPAARDLFKSIAHAYRDDDAYGAEHPRTLTARHNVAHWTGMAGDAATARDLFAALLPVRDRVSGAEDPDTLDARFALARWTGEAGDPAAARDQLGTLLPVCQRVFGPEHWRTLQTRHELAYWTGLAGDAATARDRLAELLPMRERVSSPEHPATLAVRGSLARWTGEAGDPAAARDQLAACCPCASGCPALEHPDTLERPRQLAGLTGQAGAGAPPGTSSARCCRCLSGSSARSTRTPCARARACLLDWGSRGSGRRRTPEHLGHPRRPGRRDHGPARGVSRIDLALLLFQALTDLHGAAAGEAGRSRDAAGDRGAAGAAAGVSGRAGGAAGRAGCPAGRRRAGPGVVALVGLGGAGKTSVAVEYAYRQLAGCGVVWQLPAEEPAALAAGFGELAARLGGGDAPADPVAAVHAALARRDDWLLVFDNVPDPGAVSGLVPPAGAARVVITSRYRLLARRPGAGGAGAGPGRGRRVLADPDRGRRRPGGGGGGRAGR